MEEEVERRIMTEGTQNFEINECEQSDHQSEQELDPEQFRQIMVDPVFAAYFANCNLLSLIYSQIKRCTRTKHRNNKMKSMMMMETLIILILTIYPMISNNTFCKMIMTMIHNKTKMNLKCNSTRVLHIRNMKKKESRIQKAITVKIWWIFISKLELKKMPSARKESISWIRATLKIFINKKKVRKVKQTNINVQKQGPTSIILICVAALRCSVKGESLQIEFLKMKKKPRSNLSLRRKWRCLLQKGKKSLL